MPTIVQLVNATTGIEVYPKTQLAAIVDWSSATSSFVTSSGDAQTITSRKTFNNASGIAISNGTTTANFYVDANGYLHTNLPLISDSFIGAYGATSSSGGSSGGGVDLSSVWNSLTTNIDDYSGRKIDLNHLYIDNDPTSNSNNLVKSGGVYTALNGKQNILTFDSTPIQNSTNPVTSGGVYAAIASKQGVLTFDNVPTSGSNNPVKSGGIYTALTAKQNTLTPETGGGISITTVGGITYISSTRIAGIMCNSTALLTKNGTNNAVNFNIKINGSTSGVSVDSTTSTVNLTVPTSISSFTYTGDGTKFLADNGSWKTVSGGAGGEGGEDNVIDAIKLNNTALSVDNTKTINFYIKVNGNNLAVSNNSVNIDLSGYATTAALANKQNVLTAGEGITIIGNVISATGGSGGGGTSGVTSVDSMTGVVSLENKYIQLTGSSVITGSLTPSSNSTNINLGSNNSRWKYMYGQYGYFYGLNLASGGLNTSTLYVDSSGALHCTLPIISDSYISAYGAGNSANVISQMWTALAGNTAESINVSHLPYAGTMSYDGNRTMYNVIGTIQDRLDALESTVENM